MPANGDCKLNAADWGVLRQTGECGLSVYESLQALISNEHKVRNTIRKLRRLGLIESFPLFPSRNETQQRARYERVYYRLTTKGCNALGFTAKVLCGEAGKQARAQRYAVLDFIWLAERRRQLVTVRDMREETELKELDDGGRAVFFMEQSAGEAYRLGQVFVDWKASADVRRLVRKCRKFLRRRRTIEVLRQRIDQGEFVFVFVVAHEGKGNEIVTAAGKADDLPAPVEYHVCSELERLL